MAVSINHEAGDNRLRTVKATLGAAGDALAVRLLDADPAAACRIQVRPSGATKKVDYEAALTDQPASADWFDAQATAGQITADANFRIEGGIRLHRFTIPTGATGGVVALSGPGRFSITHTSQTTATVADAAVTVPLNQSRVVELKFTSSGEPYKPEARDYSWSITSADVSKVSVAFGGVNANGNPIFDLSRIAAGQVVCTVRGAPHHGGSQITATITVS